MTDIQERLQQAATTQTIRVRLQRGDVTRLREIALAEHRSAQDQAEYLLEMAIREYDAGDAEE